MKHRVAITGLGLVCSQGQDVSLAFKAWCAGQTGIREHQVGEAPYTATLSAAQCSQFDRDSAVAALGIQKVMTMDRVSQLSTVAAQNAWDDAGCTQLDDAALLEAGVFWGTGGGGSHTLERSYRDLLVKNKARTSPLSVVLGMNNAAASNIAMHLKLGGDCLTYSVACASSTIAIGEAMQKIQYGQLTMAIAGGGEAGMPFGMLKAWESMQVMAKDTGKDAEQGAQCKPFDADRTGLILGEGAAAIMLESWDHAHARGAKIYAELVGYGSSCDHTHLTAPKTPGQRHALTKAVNSAGIVPKQIDYINAHGTGTLEGDPVEVQSLRHFLGNHAAQTMISSTKSVHGHLLGAACAIEALVCIKALETGDVPHTAGLSRIAADCEGLDHVVGRARLGADPQYALSNSFAFGGSNAVLVFRKVATSNLPTASPSIIG